MWMVCAAAALTKPVLVRALAQVREDRRELRAHR
jgi:hypothetical protein